MDDPPVRRGLEFGHDYPCPAEPAVNKCAANCLPKCCRPGVRVDRLEWSPRRRLDRAKFAAPPNVHRLADSRRSLYRSGDVLVNERKASFRSVPARQYRPRHHMLMCWRSPALRWSRPAPQCRAESGRPGMDPRTASPGLAELGRRVGASERTLSRLFRDEVGMGDTMWPNQLRLHLATLMLAGGRTVTHC
jgi:AraC-like DNA-binding protein